MHVSTLLGVVLEVVVDELEVVISIVEELDVVVSVVEELDVEKLVAEELVVKELVEKDSDIDELVADELVEIIMVEELVIDELVEGLVVEGLVVDELVLGALVEVVVDELVEVKLVVDELVLDVLADDVLLDNEFVLDRLITDVIGVSELVDDVLAVEDTEVVELPEELVGIAVDAVLVRAVWESVVIGELEETVVKLVLRVGCNTVVVVERVNTEEADDVREDGVQILAPLVYFLKPVTTLPNMNKLWIRHLRGAIDAWLCRSHRLIAHIASSWSILEGTVLGRRFV